MIFFIVVNLSPKLSNLSVLILDNYDSFTYNLLHYLEQYIDEIEVHRNDQIALGDIERFDAIVLSPGPGLPKAAGIMMEVLERYSNRKPILGVCLGLQAIVEHFGGSLRNIEQVKHGISSSCWATSDSVLFDGISSPFEIGHYHSWVANEDLPEQLEVTALNEDKLLMALRHRELPIEAVQFHPESVMTPMGMKMIENWCKSLR